MHSNIEMDEGLQRLKSIIREFPPSSPHWNEAQNRFQFVDRLLIECLGWEQPNMEVERTDEGGGRSDYILGRPAKAVLEAKREARKFGSLPTGRPTAVRKLNPLLLASPDFQDAVHQVIGYCSLQGAPIGIVCNGPQLAIFQAISIGHPPLEGECFFFNGFGAYLEFFPLLWTLLSPEGIAENRAYRELALHRNPRIPAKASQVIAEPMQYRYRNGMQEELREIGSLLLEEIEDDPQLKPEFYKECYVPIEANNRHLLLSKQIISSRYRRVSGDGVQPASLDAATRTGQLGDQFLAAAGSRPIVVIGDVGVGKTSFFENLYFSLSTTTHSRTYFININLGVKANLTSDIKSYILDSITDALVRGYDIDINDTDFVEAVYHDAIRAFDRTPEGQLKGVDERAYKIARIGFLNAKVSKRDAHMHASLAHIAKGRTKKIILVLDNADQRKFEFQQEVFLIAQELAATRSLYVFVALRPSTFFLSKTSGTLAAYQNKILTISPPPAAEVIEKRLTFALRVAEGHISPASLENIRLNLTNVAAFLRATLRSVRRSDDIKTFLSNVTGGNIRRVMEMITSFCGSPNVDAKKIVNIELEENAYFVPIHEFTKHALLGEYAYYNPQSSVVACNVFDVSAADPREHFLASLIIAFLSSNLGIRDNDGFVSGQAILEEMQKHGYIEEQVSNALRRIAHKRLVETPHGHFWEIDVPITESPSGYHFRATSTGIYHARYWIGEFTFLDATAIDTPIFEEAVRSQIAELASSFDIKDRYRKASLFRDYLEAKWHLASIEASYFDLPAVFAAQTRSWQAVGRFVDGREQAFSAKARAMGARPAGRKK